ncbi:hypothetical protein ACLOJK_040710 [Asimina triloba]
MAAKSDQPPVMFNRLIRSGQKLGDDMLGPSPSTSIISGNPAPLHRPISKSSHDERRAEQQGNDEI